jgi:CTP-dependent riboflavin kinase
VIKFKIDIEKEQEQKIMNNQIKIKGKMQKGFGEASHTIPRQKQFFKKYIKGIDNYYDGTINLLLEKPIIILHPDIYTEPIEWTRGFKESFEFLNIKLEIDAFSHDAVYNGFIYIAHRSPHFADPFYQEILAPNIYGNDCKFFGIIKKILTQYANIDKYKYFNIIINKPIKEENGFLII